MSQRDQDKDATDGDAESAPERRKHWTDRRMLADRRNPERQLHAGFDCRSGVHRRKSDLGGELAEGEVWWRDEDKIR